MRRIGLLLLVSLFMASAAFAGTPDPWRVCVTDMNPNGPNTSWVANDVGAQIPMDGWGSSGGPIYCYSFWCVRSEASYNATTGAISFGTATYGSLAGKGLYPKTTGVSKSGSAWKAWQRWFGGFEGKVMMYSSSTDGLNWAAATQITTYGSTIQNTGTYDAGGAYRAADGSAWTRVHDNSFAPYQGLNGHGLGTCTTGETEWWDIDTQGGDGGFGGCAGDPITEPHTPGAGQYKDGKNYHQISRACDGNIFFIQGAMNNGWPSGAPGYGWGAGVVIGTAGEMCGGDQYIWLADPDSNNTQGVKNSLLSGIQWSGLSGPSLRTHGNTSGSRGVEVWQVGLKPNQYDPAAQFVMFYMGFWDTNSSGPVGTKYYDVSGLGLAKLGMSKNKADLNFDGTVSALDISGFSGAYGSTSGQANYNPDCDFNSDGKVSALDISGFSGRYGSNCNYISP